MKKALKIVSLVIIVAIVVFLVLSYVGTRKNRTQVAIQIDSLSNLKQRVAQNESAIQTNANLVDANTELVSKNTNLIGANALVIESNLAVIDENSKEIKSNRVVIDENSNQISELQKAQKELRGVVTAHGYKVNRLVWELIFKIAYGDSPTARTAWNQYCGCANKSLWEEAIEKLNLVQVQKMLRLQKIEEEISETEDRLNHVKPRCFTK